MRQIVVLVEGQTEEAFVKQVLADYLGRSNTYVTPRIIVTKINKGGQNFKGGIFNYDQIRRDVISLLADKSIYVTTFIDFYGLPSDFPGHETATEIKDPYAKITYLEQEFASDIDNGRFIPYLQLHEFEALLFSNNLGFEKFFSSSPNTLAKLKEITEAYPNPEYINDNPNTAPSKRILKIINNYRKPLYGATITKEIGIEVIIEKCPHFKNWTTKLNSLGSNYEA